VHTNTNRKEIKK